jgi:hypothetical protein
VFACSSASLPTVKLVTVCEVRSSSGTFNTSTISDHAQEFMQTTNKYSDAGSRSQARATWEQFSYIDSLTARQEMAPCFNHEMGAVLRTCRQLVTMAVRYEATVKMERVSTATNLTNDKSVAEAHIGDVRRKHGQNKSGNRHRDHPPSQFTTRSLVDRCVHALATGSATIKVSIQMCVL